MGGTTVTVILSPWVALAACISNRCRDHAICSCEPMAGQHTCLMPVMLWVSFALTVYLDSVQRKMKKRPPYFSVKFPPEFYKSLHP